MNTTTMMMVVAVSVLIGLVVVMMASRRHRQHRQHRQHRHDQITNEISDTIFVSVPCFDDSIECARTICDLFARAQCPQRVFVGVYEQMAGDVPLLNLYDREARQHNQAVYSNNVRVVTVPAKDARGPMYARGIIERTMYRKERFFMTIDSHMRFTDGWDSAAIGMFRELENPKAVLTTLPAAYDRARHTIIDSTATATFAVVDRVDSDQFPILSYRHFLRAPRHAFPTPLYCPTFSFALGYIVRECPTDLSFEYIFFPEVMIRSGQMFRRGYTMYTPPQPLCFHCNDRSYRTTYWSQMDEAAEQRHALSVDRARALFNVNLCRTCSVQHSEHGMDRLDHEFVLESDLSAIRKRYNTREFIKYCGIVLDAEATQITRAAHLGCTGRKTTCDEHVAKFGSSKTFRQLMSSEKIY